MKELRKAIRHSGLKAIALALVVVGMFGACTTADTSAKKGNDVNIVWIYAEDVSPWYSCYGNKVVNTPNIDRMAENGVMFTNTYAACPVCSPSRSGIITGMMPTTIGAHQHHSARTVESQHYLPDSTRTIPELFKNAGYYTFNDGKDDYNFSYDRSKMYSGNFKAYFWYTLKGEGHWRTADRKKGQPFFGQFQLEGDKYTLPQPAREKEYFSRIPEDKRIKGENVDLPPYFPDIKLIRDRLARHYDAVQMVDQDVERVLRELKEDNLLENTIVILLSDHGNESLRFKQFCYDGGIQIPFIVSYFGNDQKILEKIKKGTVRTDMVAGMDIAATTLALAGLEIPKTMEGKDVFAPDFHREYIIAGRDRCDFTIDRIRCVRNQNFKYIKNYYPDRSYMQPQYRETRPEFTVLKSMYEKGELNEVQAKYWEPTRPAEELYDVINDPYEINNLAELPEYAEKMDSMRTILDNWIAETNDQGQYAENPEDLRFIYHCWLDRCTDPVFDYVKSHPIPLTPPWLVELYDYQPDEAGH